MCNKEKIICSLKLLWLLCIIVAISDDDNVCFVVVLFSPTVRLRFFGRISYKVVFIDERLIVFFFFFFWLLLFVFGVLYTSLNNVEVLGFKIRKETYCFC